MANSYRQGIRGVFLRNFRQAEQNLEHLLDLALLCLALPHYGLLDL